MIEEFFNSDLKQNKTATNFSIKARSELGVYTVINVFYLFGEDSNSILNKRK